jgi:predicted ATP-grasp superfamily ATP-dependent carboligase
MNTAETILIIGASTRAAAFSALRAGLKPMCLDFFADRDHAAVCAVQRAETRAGADGLEQLALDLPHAPWLYTGPLENHPERVERISLTHRLYGNTASTLHGARNPLRVAEVLREHGLPYLETRRDGQGLPRDGTWLIKPIASAGGRLVQHLDHAAVPLAEPSYLQQFLAGPSHSALFLARHAGSAELVGVTRQLLGRPGSPFAYRGNIGPCRVPAPLMSRLHHLGNVFCSAFRLVGLFGVDFIWHDGEPWPVEINPRYTAAVEIFELALHRTLLSEHLRACGMDLAASHPSRKPHIPTPRAPVVGKTTLYARRNSMAPEIDFEDPRCRDLFAVPAVADVPWPGSAIAAGEPFMTLFATGQDVRECEDRLAEQEAFWQDRLEA